MDTYLANILIDSIRSNKYCVAFRSQTHVKLMAILDVHNKLLLKLLAIHYNNNINTNNSVGITFKKTALCIKNPVSRFQSCLLKCYSYIIVRRHKTFIVIDCCNQFIFIPFTQTSAELVENELSDGDVTDDIESDASTKTGR